MAQVFPTKSNLMAQKRSLALASQGYDLMDRKRNILVREMMQLIDRAAVIQDEIATAYSSAYKALQRANITLGVVGEFAKTVPVETGLKLDYRSVMGVELPIVKMEESAPGLYYGLDSTNSQLDDVYLKFCEVKRLTVELAEVESSVYRLAVAIQKTQKRANALNNIMIPQFTATIKYITEVLEEKEREDFSRLKVIKKQQFGNHNIFQRIDAATVFFDLVGKHIAGFFHFGKPDEFDQKLTEIGNRGVQLRTDACKRIRVQIGAFPLFDGNRRNRNAHDVFDRRLQAHGTRRHRDCLFDDFGAVDRTCKQKRTERRRHFSFDLLAQAAVLFDINHKLTNRLVRFILEKFVPSDCGFQAVF